MLVNNRMTWQKEADVVVVGLGGAGSVAAIAAHDAGAQVCVLEKQPAGNHMTTTSMSAGAFIHVNDVPAAVQYMVQLNSVSEGIDWTDRSIVQAWAERASQNLQWVEGMGISSKSYRKGGEHRHVPGREALETFMPAGMGFAMSRSLKSSLQSRGVEMLFNAPAQRLLTNSRGEVVGVRARVEGRELNVRAAKAVIMTTGGFEFDEAMKLNYLRVYPAYFYGSPANTGDGIRMAQDVGASLWHMNCCSARLVAKFPDFPFAFTIDYGGRGSILNISRYIAEGDPCAFIIVDKHGRRYTNDGDLRTHTLYYELAMFDSHHLEFPRVPSYAIFDAARIQHGPLPIKSGATGAHKLYMWSSDNEEELRKGWIIQGDTVRELAQKLGIDPARLDRTVKTYNSYCRQGADPEFQRPPQHLKPLTQPPFFAVRLWPGGPNTQGGPRRNERAQVLHADGGPIPRLYAAGELGSIFGMLYPGAGGNISECIAFGRIAGENAAGEKAMASQSSRVTE